MGHQQNPCCHICSLVPVPDTELLRLKDLSSDRDVQYTVPKSWNFLVGRIIFSGFNEQLLGVCLWNPRICLVARETSCVIKKLEVSASSSNLEKGEG